MRKLLLTVSLLSYALLPSPSARATDDSLCFVEHRIRSCDYFMVRSAKDFAILEWYGGHDPDTGDEMRGDLSSHGMHTFHHDDDETKVYVEDFGLSELSALRKLVAKCGD